MDKRRAREIQSEIARVLLQDWDPIGVCGEPEIADEYDHYVGGVYRLLTSRPGPDRVAEHLQRIEVDQMGLGRGRRGVERNLSVAEKLLAIDVRLEDVSAGSMGFLTSSHSLEPRQGRSKEQR